MTGAGPNLIFFLGARMQLAKDTNHLSIDLYLRGLARMQVSDRIGGGIGNICVMEPAQQELDATLHIEEIQWR